MFVNRKTVHKGSFIGLKKNEEENKKLYRKKIKAFLELREMAKTVHLIIKGQVQGVFYRASAKDMAMKAGLTGWVRNTKSGDVEVLATGEEDVLAQFIAWCGTGPSKATVEEVTVTDMPFSPFDGFEIRR